MVVSSCIKLRINDRVPAGNIAIPVYVGERLSFFPETTYLNILSVWKSANYYCENLFLQLNIWPWILFDEFHIDHIWTRIRCKVTFIKYSLIHNAHILFVIVMKLSSMWHNEMVHSRGLLELFVIIGNGWKPLTITKSSTLDGCYSSPRCTCVFPNILTLAAFISVTFPKNDSSCKIS